VTRARWVFLRAYLLVAALVVVTGLGLEALLVDRDQDALESREAALVEGTFRYAEELLRDSGSDNNFLLQRRLQEQLALPVTIYPLEDFRALEETQARLLAGQTVQLFDTDDRVVFYRRLGEAPWVLALGPGPALDNERAKWVVPLFYALIALAVYLWIRPLARDLEQLQDAAGDFGQQDFSSRVVLPQGSWLSPLAEAFNSMAQRIEWLLQSHRELTHAVSHELRTPLARLRFGLEMLGDAQETDRERYRAAMNEDIEELNKLVEEMLGYAELEQGNLTAQLAPLDLATWLTAYVDYYNSRSPAIAVSLDAPLAATVVQADERLLTRALDNLVGNAQRFADATIRIAVRVTQGRGELRVVDDGPGMPAEQRDAVLSAYVRLAPEDEEKRQGFGLGLAIVNRIMQLHGGEIFIVEAPCGGAEIGLTWPA